MISFQEVDPGIPLLAPIVNSAGGDIVRFLLAENYLAAITEQWVVITESRVAQLCRLTRDCLTSSNKNSSVNYSCKTLTTNYRMCRPITCTEQRSIYIGS